jgi:broad specificity phosphatase PhoE
MRKLLAAVAGILGFAWLRRRRHEPQQPAAPDPAEELRAKLAQNRDAEPEPAPTEPEPDVGERRQDVHDRARAAIDELSGSE